MGSQFPTLLVDLVSASLPCSQCTGKSLEPRRTLWGVLWKADAGPCLPSCKKPFQSPGGPHPKPGSLHLDIRILVLEGALEAA